MIKTMMTAAVLSLALAGGAFAQTAAPATPAATAKPAKPAMSAEKQAISKACSSQADEKGLKGKERKKFRSACKRNGGKAA